MVAATALEIVDPLAPGDPGAAEGGRHMLLAHPAIARFENGGPSPLASSRSGAAASVALFALGLAALLAAAPTEAGAQVPTFAEVSGHEVSERIAQHAHIIRYLERLEEASPRVRTVRLGESWEGRELRLAIVTSPENHERLDDIQANARRLADPRATPSAEVDAILEDHPVVLWIQGSIHGFELSGTEGMLLLLEHLTTRDDPGTLRALEQAVILVEPLVNPDGRDAFAHFNHQRISVAPNPERDDWSNDFTTWEARQFRTGHYFFDNNRDWSAQTQRVTRARAAAILQWRPQALIDAHEWTPDVEFFFPHMWGGGRPRGGMDGYSERWCDEFGAAFAATFDAEGRPFTTRERYGCGFPGSVPESTTAWAPWMGAVGILFEQGSTRGLAMTRPDGTVRTLRYAAENQYLGSWALVEHATAHRERILREYVEQHRAFVEEDAGGIRRYLLPPSRDPNLRAEAVNLMLRSGVEVHELTEARSLGALTDAEGQAAGDREFPAGTHVVEVAQPRAVALLFGPGASVTLPYQLNLEAYGSRDGRELPLRRIEEPLPAATDAIHPFEPSPVRVAVGDDGAETEERPAYAYLLDGRQAPAVVAAHRLREDGYRVWVSTSPLRFQERDYASGTVVVPLAENPETVHESVAQVAGELHLALRGEDTGLAPPGFPSIGSASLVGLEPTRIAMVAEEPVEAYSFGWSWFTLERQYGVPITVLRAGSIAGTPLGRFQVLVLPDLAPGAFAHLLGEEGLDRIRRWVRDGGVLVTMGRATELARGELGLIGLRSLYETSEGEGLASASLSETYLPIELAEAEYDPSGLAQGPWLPSGYEDQRLHALVSSSRVYVAPEGRGEVIARYGELSTERRGDGGGWRDAAERFADGVYLYHEQVGRGRVVAFAEDPNFRAQARGTDRLFLNAVLVGASAR
jgi:hypothetical protein